ncbi:MAG: DUF4177 domain-containing protein [Rhodobacteraceae bacterium]|nr:DUF4177 domain-containing protein [Paracoccaceae bacterium]MBR9819513.1 DUF4177 domain-containing protein [Paracoccaceae bacterium]
MNWEYRVVPAPDKSRRFRGVRGAEARFARTIEEVINHMAASGWEYCRAEILPEAGRRRAMTYHNLLVFRRDPESAPQPSETRLLEAPEVAPRPEEDDEAPAGLGQRLRQGAARVIDGVMARGPARGRREEPLFQHEAMRARPAPRPDPAPDAGTTDAESDEATGDERRD